MRDGWWTAAVAGAVFGVFLSTAGTYADPIAGDPWQFNAQDIYGQSLVPGGTTYHPQTAGTYTIGADGHDIWDAEDDFRYLSLSLWGDFAVSVCVLDNPFQGGNDPWAKAGLMVRQNASAGSAFIDFVATRGNGLALQWRDVQDGSANWPGVSALDAASAAYPVWLRLRRTGDLCEADYSQDGVNWVHRNYSIHQVNLTGPVPVGLCLTSHQPGVLTTVKFTDFRLNRMLHVTSAVRCWRI